MKAQNRFKLIIDQYCARTLVTHHQEEGNTMHEGCKPTNQGRNFVVLCHFELSKVWLARRKIEGGREEARDTVKA